MKKPFNYHGSAYDSIMHKDKRRRAWAKQRAKDGFDDSETWSLRDSIAKYTLPRLKRFREIEVSFPGGLKSREEWNEILDQMIFAFEAIIEDGDRLNDEWPKVDRGLKLFAKWFMNLWW